MANLHDCIQRAVDHGELDNIRGAAALSDYDQLVARYEQTMPRHQAEWTAAKHLKEAISASRRSRKHAILNQLQAMTRLRAQINAAPDPGRALKALLRYSQISGFAGENIEMLTRSYIKSINAGLNDVLQKTSRTLLGKNRRPALLRDVIRELHLEDTGDAAAKALADAVRHQQKRMRQQFNGYGGDIGEIADFGVTHAHDRARVIKAGRDDWIAAIAPRLARDRIIDHQTGKPFAAKGARPPRAAERRFLADIYDGIATRGWDNRAPSMAPGGKALVNRRADPRVLHFASGSDWLEYNAAFGTTDPFSAMVGGLHSLARDVAQMRVLGPNPKLGLEYAAQVAEKRALTAGDHALAAQVRKDAQLSRTMLAHLDGSVNQTENEGWARFFGATRQVLTSIQLGSATLSAVTDLATIRTAAAVVGMKPNNVMSRAAKLMSSHATRETAAQMGYVADTLADTGAAAARYLGEVVGGDIPERLSGFTLRASGLSFWTDMNRLAFQQEFAGHLAANASRTLDQVDAPLRDLLTSRGITPADWDLLRDPATLFIAPNGAKFLSPMHWLEHQTTLSRAEAEGLSMRLQMLIEEQLEYAVPTAAVEGRARLIGNTAPGTFSGELLRSTTMYKGFALTLTLNQIRRFMAQPTPLDKTLYAAKMSAGLLLLGGVAVQLKELAKGNDPRPMTDAKFWGGAAFQGGGLGIFGDFFAAETSRAGGGLAETLAGPVAGLAGNVIRPVASNIARAVEGDDLLLGRDVASFARYNTPVASSLWYARTAWDRLVADQMQLLLDPDAETEWRRQMRRRERDYGTTTFWSRGGALPDRMPDLANAGASR